MIRVRRQCVIGGLSEEPVAFQGVKIALLR